MANGTAGSACPGSARAPYTPSFAGSRSAPRGLSLAYPQGVRAGGRIGPHDPESQRCPTPAPAQKPGNARPGMELVARLADRADTSRPVPSAPRDRLANGGGRSILGKKLARQNLGRRRLGPELFCRSAQAGCDSRRGPVSRRPARILRAPGVPGLRPGHDAARRQAELEALAQGLRLEPIQALTGC